ncbi:putative feruloyl esterase B-1 [Westerdykella ornata]|uniref:Carboxylic ester hydrolase n=1 Tax=Westerdykella ornata TaxID=318751 RepID=A0A6A6JI40_WESOR|nr:putative feruloyl esterase B-1 [Westerdykella ornata]KAF2275753.1 putative feruloyl esterase B-1 [Westerdykella ornata]
MKHASSVEQLCGRLWTPHVVIKCAQPISHLNEDYNASARESSFPSRCASLPQNLNLKDYPGATVTIAKYLPANSTIDHAAEGRNATCIAMFDAPPLPVNICRLQLRVPTSHSSGVIMEAWLPENWSGRFLSTGNGGLAGCIQYSDIAYATKYGFAAVGTDNGHPGTSPGAFYHQPEVLRDFVWRALYTGVVVGKEITRQFYGKRHAKSYYFGCSTGGRQGFKAVQDHPELFDGVVAGAPAIEFTGTLGWATAMMATLWNPASEEYLSEQDWQQVTKEVVRQCDGKDGVKDGIIEAVQNCKPDLLNLKCRVDNQSEWCLSEVKFEGLKRVYGPLVDQGMIRYPGLTPGAEAATQAGWKLFRDLNTISEWIRFVVKEDEHYNVVPTTQDAVDILRTNPFNIRTFETDISKFRKRGGKVLHWHGQVDELLPIGTSDRYYDLVAQTLKASPNELDSFYRYFRISGMNHCAGGPGGWAIGQAWGTSASDHPNDNVLLSIVDWVEKGKAPGFIRGTKWLNDDPAQGVVFTRKHCKYPDVNRYFGTGNGTDEDGWRCVRNGHGTH